MSISIHELLAVARESEGVKAVKGDAILSEKRFAPDTRYMVEFLLLEQKEWFGEKGEYHRYFLTKEAYRELIDLQNQGVLRFQKQALVLEGNAALSSSPGICPGPGVGSLTGWKRKHLCRSMAPRPGTLSPEISIERERREW